MEKIMIPVTIYTVDAYDCNLNAVEQVLDATAIRQAPISLKKGAMLVRCLDGNPKTFVITKPEMTGDDICVFNEALVSVKGAAVKFLDSDTKKIIAKSRNSKQCPPIDFRSKRYPGKGWFYIDKNLPLAAALNIRAFVESKGIALLKESDWDAKTDFRKLPLVVKSISDVSVERCVSRPHPSNEKFVQCYSAIADNTFVYTRWFNFGKLENGEYRFVDIDFFID
ncbi:hypothetical protein [Undibacterium sp. TJN19]|uniref:hypothetical protein n=1 Tax=Undibacterium sp. TJN19 TaxID=3413055 RepID=UPI003BEFE787